MWSGHVMFVGTGVYMCTRSEENIGFKSLQYSTESQLTQPSSINMDSVVTDLEVRERSDADDCIVLHFLRVDQKT